MQHNTNRAPPAGQDTQQHDSNFSKNIPLFVMSSCRKLLLTLNNERLSPDSHSDELDFQLPPAAQTPTSSSLGKILWRKLTGFLFSSTS